MSNILILHPGEMGAEVARDLARTGHNVMWVSAGRSAGSTRRAAGLKAITTLQQACNVAEIIISVCPPASATELAQSVAACNFEGLYIDANAIAPKTMTNIKSLFRAQDVDVVDAGIVGPPPERAGLARLFLSGSKAELAASVFSNTNLAPVIVSGEVGAASAVKMSYAAWSKGTAALLLNIRALAEQHGITDALLAEWDTSQPGLSNKSAATRMVARKAWRFAGEMEEIAQTFEDADLPGAFHTGAANLYTRLASCKDREDVSLAEILQLINTPE